MDFYILMEIEYLIVRTTSQSVLYILYIYLYEVKEKKQPFLSLRSVTLTRTMCIMLQKIFYSFETDGDTRVINCILRSHFHFQVSTLVVLALAIFF